MARHTLLVCVSVAGLGMAGLGWAAAEADPAGTPTSQPTSRPTPLPADQLLKQMLRPNEKAQQVLRPESNRELIDVSSGKNATAPNAPVMSMLREGTYIVDRTGRIRKAEDGLSWEYVFDSDGRTLRDPPMLVLPNLNLQQMEDRVRDAQKNTRFRVTGMVTEYRGRNGVLIEKAVAIPEAPTSN